MSLTILYVDGRSINRELLGVFLEKNGYRALLAANGVEALGWLRAGKVDLILMDVALPGMEGLEFLQCVRSSGHRIPAIILTDVRDKSAVIRAAALGVRDYVLRD